MKAIILCAGKGKRTGLAYPKCIHHFSNKTSLLDKNLKNLQNLGFKNREIILATGFRENLIKQKTQNKFNYIKNINYASTNMVYSFNEVLKKIILDDVCVIYADILYQRKDLDEIIKSKKDIITLVDSDWLIKWKKKRAYKEDLEELRIRKNKINLIGKKTNNLENIDGRFVGIIKFSKKIILKIQRRMILQNILRKNSSIDFTNFLMRIIQEKFSVYALKKKINWNEFDTKQDFDNY